MGWYLLIAGCWGGLLALERRAFLQAMFSRPLVAATGAGLLLEDPSAGLHVGLVFELFYLGSASLGGVHPDHETLPAIGGTALASCLAQSSGAPGTPAVWGLAILLAAPLGPFGRRLENAFDARAVRYLGTAKSSADAENFRRVARQNLWGMWPHFVSFGALSACWAALGFGLWRLQPALPLAWARGLAWAYPAMACAAAAIAVRSCRTKYAAALAVAGGAAGLLAQWQWGLPWLS